MPITVTPTVRAVGSVANGIGAITPGLPAGTIAGDLLVMFLETADQAITVSGWTELPVDSPQSVAGSTRLTVFYKISDGADARITSDSGDHQIGRIIGITVNTFDPVTPIDSSAGGTRSSAGTTATIPGPTTGQNQCLIMAASSHDLDQSGAAFTTASWTNANLASITERINNSATDGNGGGIGVATGEKVTAGAVGNTTVTVTSSVGGMISLAIAPATKENILVSQVPVEAVVVGLSTAVISQEPVEIIAGNETPPPLPSFWIVGVIDVPGSTGSQVITIRDNLRKIPKGVIFFGANWTDLDTVVTDAGTAVFRGMATETWDSPGSITQDAAAVGPGDQHYRDNTAILNLTQDGTAAILYQASVTDFDRGEFTLNWTTVDGGGYKIVYAALFDVPHCAGHFASSVDDTLTDVGFEAGASVVHGCWGNGTTVSGDDRSQEWYGSASYRTGENLSAGMSVQCFPTSQSSQFQCYLDHFPPDSLLVVAQHFTGPFLTGSNIKAYPSGSADPVTGKRPDFKFLGDTTNSGMVMIWDDPDNRTGTTVPEDATSGVVSVSLPFDPGLVIGYSVSDEPHQQGTGGHGAAGFSVSGFDSEGVPVQWGALIDRIDQSAYQSFTKIPSVVTDAPAVRTLTCDLMEAGFNITTVDDDVSAETWLWHAFGHPFVPSNASWVPQLYRRVSTY